MDLTSRQQIIVGLLIFLLVFFVPQPSAAAQEEGQITVVFDFSHDQPFSLVNRNFTQAIEYFNDYPEYLVQILEEGELTAENLSRTHFLVIPNPGRNYSTSELEVITNYVQQGGSLFLLCDYQITDRQIGNPIALNSILQALPDSGIQFTTVTEDNETQGDVIIDPIHTQLLPYNIPVNATNITSDLYREAFGAGITSLLVAGGSLTTAISERIIWLGAETSQSVTIDGQPILNQPGWLAGFDLGSSHIVLSTSTTMFSDTICLVTNQSWFESADNSVLWYNIFKWMATPLIQDPTPIMIFFVALVLVAGIAVFIYSIWLKKRGR